MAGFNLIASVFVAVSAMVGYTVLRERRLLVLAVIVSVIFLTNILVIFMMFLMGTYYDWFLGIVLIGTVLSVASGIMAIGKGDARG